MATCLSIVSQESKKVSKLQLGKMATLPASRTNRQIERESQIQFMNVFTDHQKESSMDMLKILQLKNFCSQVNSLETIVKDYPQALQYFSQYVRDHKGPPLDFHQDGFWTDLDAHLAVFHEPNNCLRRGSDNSQPQAGTSSIDQEDAALLKHIKVLRKGKPGTPKHRSAIKALGLRSDSTPDASKDKTPSEESKKSRGICFDMRDKGECRRGNKCRFSHDSTQIKTVKEQKASLSVFSVNMASTETDQALMEANHGLRLRVDHDLILLLTL